MSQWLPHSKLPVSDMVAWLRSAALHRRIVAPVGCSAATVGKRLFRLLSACALALQEVADAYGKKRPQRDRSRMDTRKDTAARLNSGRGITPKEDALILQTPNIRSTADVG